MKDGRTFAVNRRARYDYEILDSIEAGLSLLGTEIKAMREGRATIAEAFGKVEKGQMWLMNAHISPYSAAGPESHDPTRPRKLLLHKEQIARLSKQVDERGLTLIPLRLYLKGHRAKVELALAKGRRRYDKRRAIIDRDREKEARQAIRRE
ncbi:MAG: SsrA-binding protein SmpB [SAR202 cluster bacterium]|jgi:SsrA-binding protein|nr:SsrA-binding protein SmpB [SAR202 cluster bacterium]